MREIFSKVLLILLLCLLLLLFVNFVVVVADSADVTVAAAYTNISVYHTGPFAHVFCRYIALRPNVLQCIAMSTPQFTLSNSFVVQLPFYLVYFG